MSRLNGYLDSFVDQAGYRQHAGIWSGISRGDTIIQSSGTIAVSGYRNFDVQILGGSGAFKYIGGAFEGWHVKMANLNPSAGSGRNGFFPLAVSGIFSLQDAYVGNPDLIIQSEANAGGAGTMIFTTNDRKWKLVQGQRAPINISGALKVPIVGGVSFNETGDIAVCHHQQIVQGPSFTYPATFEEHQARALGVGTLTLNTGSGIVNISTGSGIAMVGMKADTRIPFLLDNWGRLGMSGILMPDQIVLPNLTGSGVTFMVAGMYLVNYHISFFKTLGNTARTIAARAILKNKGQEGEGPGAGLGGTTAIPGSIAYCIVNNVTTLCAGTASATFLVNADVGQFLGFEAAAIGIGTVAGQVAVAVASGSSAIIQYIGPRRTFPVLD